MNNGRKVRNAILAGTILMGITAPAINVGWQSSQSAVVFADETSDSVATWMPDTALQDAVQAALGADVPLTQAALANLQTLDLSFSGVTNLSGLEYATHLTKLDLSGTAIDNIAPLANLHELTDLNLRLNKATTMPNLAPLATTAIQKLNLVGDDYGEQFEQLQALSDLHQLTDLDLQSNQLTQLPPISDLTQLQSLGLAGNKLTSIQDLAKLTNLTTLKVNSNQLTDLSTLVNFPKLETVSLGNNPVNDLTPLSQLTQLKAATLSQMGLTNASLAPLKNLVNLTRLSLDFNDQLSDLTPLANLTQLAYLNVSKSLVADLTPLQNLTQLTELRLENTQVANLAPLANLKQLQALSLLRSKVMDLSPLQALGNLTSLNVKSQTVTLPTLTYASNEVAPTATIFATDIDGTKIPVTYQSGIPATINQENVTFSAPTENGSSWLAWQNANTTGLSKNFTGTVEQPLQITTAVPTEKTVGLRTLKGDGSGGTSVAANFIQPTAVLQTQADGTTNLIVTAKLPESYGEDSLAFSDAKTLSINKVGDELVMTYAFALNTDQLSQKKLLANMHVNIPSIGYDHWYDVYFEYVDDATAPQTYSTTVKYVDAKTNAVLKTTDVTAELGQQVTIDLPDLAGYTAPKTAPVFTQGLDNVVQTVRYTPKSYIYTYVIRNSKNNQLVKTIQIKHDFATNGTDQLAVAGYQTVSAPYKVTKAANQTITIKAVPKTYPTTYRYINSRTGKVIKTVTKSYYTGQKITVTPPAIAGYATPKKMQTTAVAKARTLTIAYQPKTYTTTYKYLDSRTGKTIKTVKKTYYTGQITTKYQPAIAGYTTPKAAKLTAQAKNQTLTIKYTPKKYTITYKYVNAKNHKALVKNKVVKNVAYSSTQKPKALTIKGYKAKAVKAFTVKKSQTYTIYYTKK